MNLFNDKYNKAVAKLEQLIGEFEAAAEENETKSERINEKIVELKHRQAEHDYRANRAAVAANNIKKNILGE